jgi:hypothetical protein
VTDQDALADTLLAIVRHMDAIDQLRKTRSQARYRPQQPRGSATTVNDLCL